MIGRTIFITVALVAMFIGSASAKRVAPTNMITPELETRLEALDPTNPRAYFELAEDLAESNSDEERRLARRLFGLAGRIDREKYAASSALGIAELATDPRTRNRLRAAATMLPGGSPLLIGSLRQKIDGQTAFQVSEAFGEFRTGRMVKLRRLFDDPVVRRLFETSDDVLPGGVDWLEEASKNGRRGPELSQADQLALLRFELMLLESGRPTWSTLLAVEGDPPLLEIDAEGLDRLLLDEEKIQPLRRDGRWVAR